MRRSISGHFWLVFPLLGVAYTSQLNLSHQSNSNTTVHHYHLSRIHESTKYFYKSDLKLFSARKKKDFEFVANVSEVWRSQLRDGPAPASRCAHQSNFRCARCPLHTIPVLTDACCCEIPAVSTESGHMLDCVAVEHAAGAGDMVSLGLQVGQLL